MKGCVLEAILEGQAFTTLFTIFLFYPGGWDFCKEERTSEKECIEIEDRVSSVHFVLSFQENTIYSLHLYCS